MQYHRRPGKNMKDELKIIPLSPPIVLGDIDRTCDILIEEMKRADRESADLAVFPELSLTGACLGDLYRQDFIKRKTAENLGRVLQATKDLKAAFIVAYPEYKGGKIYSTKGLFYKGACLGKVRRSKFSQREKFFLRAFSSYEGPDENLAPIDLQGLKIALISYQDFIEDNYNFLQEEKDKRPDVVILSMAEACRPAAFSLWKEKSSKITALAPDLIFVGSNAGRGQSSGDFFFAGECWTCREGKVLYQKSDLAAADISGGTYDENGPVNYMKESDSDQETSVDDLAGHVEKTLVPDRQPLIPKNAQGLDQAMQISALALARRMEAIGTDQIWLGFSGGLDSCLAFLICLRTFEAKGFSKEGLHLVSMPAFGTGERTRKNAQGLGKISACDFREIPIEKVLKRHFEDIGLADDYRGLAFENAQARERTQILMDLANYKGGLVIGTGDMSEGALGWSTYGGDHLSMYQVNASFPKTMVRALVNYEKNRRPEFKEYLQDILETPISPELLPAGEMKAGMQKSEDKLGPYELHDFFIHKVLYEKKEPELIYNEAKAAFEGKFDGEKILNTLEIFYKRFIQSQFKRSCMPDGASMGPINLSPRGGLIMPSDMDAGLWLREIQRIRDKEFTR